MTHLVVGASGMLGQALLRELRRRGLATVGASLAGPDRRVDVTDAAAVAQLVAEVNPVVVWNAAAIVSLARCEAEPGLAYAVNARAVSLMVEACHLTGARLVHISTDHFFTGDKDSMHAENAPVRLLNEYARTKYAGEQYACTAAEALILRTNITGFRHWSGQPTFAEWVFQAIEDDAPLTMFTDFYTSTLDVAAFSRAACDLLERGATGLLNLAAREVAHKQAFIEAIAERLSCRLTHASTGSVEGLVPVRAESLGLDVSRAEDILGYPLPNLAAVADKLVAEYRGEK